MLIMYKYMTIITKFISLIQLTPYSKTILTKKDLLTVNKRFLPSDKIVTIAQKVGPQPQNLGVISGSRKLLIPQINPRTHLGLYQPRSTTVLSAPLLYDHRSSMNNKIISNPNIKFTSLLENKKIDLLLEEAKTAIDVQKYLEILDDIKVKNLIKTKFSEENLRNILTELQKIEVSEERKQEILYNLQRYLKNNHPTIENAQLFLDLWRKNKCEFTALDFKQKSQSIVQAREGKKRNKSKDPNKNKRLEDEQKTIIYNMFTMCKQMEENFIKFEQEPSLSCNLIQDWYNYLINRSNALPVQPEEIEINNKVLLLGKTSALKQEDVLAKNNNTQNKINESLKNKQEKTESKMLVMSTLMNNLFLDFKNEPQKIILSPLLQIWFDYLNNRGSDLPLQPAEISINNELDLLWKTFAPSQKDVLAKIKNNFKTLKEHSTLEENLKQDCIKKCFTIDDYKNEIEYVKNALNFLKICGLLSENDIKILTINSSAALIDDEGTFKLTPEAYSSFPENKNALGFTYTEKKPQIDYILTQIKEKNYVIVDEYKNKPGSVIDISYLGHKTLVILDDNTDKKIKIRIGLLTSTKDENTFLLDEYQQTNPDINKQDKKQYFRILSNFMVVDENEPLIVDMETTLFLHSVNSNDKDITEIFFKNYEDKKNIWSNNKYQLSYNANEEFIKKIAIIFFNNKLQMLEEGLKNLEEELKKLTPQEKTEKLEALAQEKLKYMEEKKLQQYISLLPAQFQELYKTLTLFNLKKQKDDKQKKKQEFKKNLENVMDLKKNKENKIKTAKDKREDYQIKKLENISNE